MTKDLSRMIRVGAAQLGPLLDQAHDQGCTFVVFPELALTTFFPRWNIDDQVEIDGYFEREMPNAATKPLFDKAKAYGIGFYLGYAELTEEDGRERRFNSSILVDDKGVIVGKYRKIHLPGHGVYDQERTCQHLETK